MEQIKKRNMPTIKSSSFSILVSNLTIVLLHVADSKLVISFTGGKKSEHAFSPAFLQAFYERLGKVLLGNYALFSPSSM